MLKFFHALIELIYPGSSLCSFCGKEVEGQSKVCVDCLQKVLELSLQRLCCPRCGHFNVGLNCKNCHKWDKALTKVIGITPYEGVYRDLIQNMKYSGERDLAKPLGYLMAERFKKETIKVDLIIPVPLHPIREMERGFNQSQILAQEVAFQLGLPMRTGLLVREKYEKPQSSYGWKDRQRILDNTFIMGNGGEINGKSILLIDDIITTGATLCSCARIIVKNGASAVYGLTWSAGMGEIF